jgi:hypothetical protein
MTHSRTPPHDLRSGWSLFPFLYRSFIDYSLRVFWRTKRSALPAVVVAKLRKLGPVLRVIPSAFMTCVAKSVSTTRLNPKRVAMAPAPVKRSAPADFKGFDHDPDAVWKKPRSERASTSGQAAEARLPNARGPRAATSADLRPTRAPVPAGGYQIAMPDPTALPGKDMSVADRIKAVSATVGQAAKLMKEHPQDSSLKVFSAPEYLFDAQISPRPGLLRHKSADVRQLTETEYHQIDAAMRELSKQHPDMLIKIPIAWKKTVERPQTEAEYLQSKGAGETSHPLHAHYVQQWGSKDPSDSRKDKAQQANDMGLEKFGPRYAHDFPHIDEQTTHLARNTVLSYFNGERVDKYNKIVGMQEVLGSGEGQQVQFASGKDYGGEHVLPNGAVATQEICRDHAVNATTHAGEIHFVHSDGVTPSNPSGKYDATSVVVHANTIKASSGLFGMPGPNRQKVEVVQDQGGQNVLTEVPPKATEGGIELYNVPSSPH